MIANIQLEFESEDDANQVLRSITPDNTPLPPGITIQTHLQNTELQIRIECNRGIDSFRGTIEDIMSAIDLSIRTMNSVE